jgi:hypothetical protein
MLLSTNFCSLSCSVFGEGLLDLANGRVQSDRQRLLHTQDVSLNENCLVSIRRPTPIVRPNSPYTALFKELLAAVVFWPCKRLFSHSIPSSEPLYLCKGGG